MMKQSLAEGCRDPTKAPLLTLFMLNTDSNCSAVPSALTLFPLLRPILILPLCVLALQRITSLRDQTAAVFNGWLNGWTTPTSTASATKCPITPWEFSSTTALTWASSQTGSTPSALSHFSISVLISRFLRVYSCVSHKCLHAGFSPPSFRTIHYYAELGQRSVFPTCEVPEHFVGQVTVLKYFSHYMEENLMDVSYTLPPFFGP